MSFRADGVLALGIEQDQVSIAAHRDCSLARIESEKLRGRRRNQLHETVDAEASLSNAARIDQAHAMLNSGTTIRNFGEIILPQLLLFFETKRAMISRDNLQVIPFQPIPKLLLIPLLPQRGSEDVLCTFKSRRIHVLE